MNITIKKSVEIRDVETWKNIAPPKDAQKQWKEGRSAKELARFATNPSFSEFINILMEELRITTKENFVCEPEAETSFKRQGLENIDMGSHGPRNHDLLMIGQTSVIGVEAKVSEGFGNTIEKEWNDAKTNNKKQRISGLLKFISNNKYNYDTIPDKVKKLPYQLLTATVGTILEAIRRKKQEAIILVLVFTGNVAKENGYENNIKKNNDAFKDFSETFFKDNEATIQEIKCRIIKKEVSIGNYVI